MAFTITFDLPLIPGIGDSLNWQVRVNNFIRNATPPTVTVIGNTVTDVTVPGIANPGPDVIGYTATPPDIIGTLGLPVAPIINFPLTVGP